MILGAPSIGWPTTTVGVPVGAAVGVGAGVGVGADVTVRVGAEVGLAVGLEAGFVVGAAADVQAAATSKIKAVKGRFRVRITRVLKCLDCGDWLRRRGWVV